MRLPIIMLLCLLLGMGVLFAQAPAMQHTVATAAADSVIGPNGNNSGIPDDDFAPGLLIFAVGALCIMLFIAGAGAVVTAGLLALLFAFISAGIFSASLAVAINRRSVLSGFRTFVLLMSSVFGTVIGACIFCFANEVFSLHFTTRNALYAGAAGGLIGGVILGFAITSITRFISRKFGKGLNQ